MGRPRGWAAARAGRPAMRSPGRPPVARREDRQRFWVAVARGMPSEDAGIEAGVSPAVGTRWFRDSGGIRPVSLAPLSGRYLSFAEREEIAIAGAWLLVAGPLYQGSAELNELDFDREGIQGKAAAVQAAQGRPSAWCGCCRRSCTCCAGAGTGRCATPR
jgi:hypothetical protein